MNGTRLLSTHPFESKVQQVIPRGQCHMTLPPLKISPFGDFSIVAENYQVLRASGLRPGACSGPGCYDRAVTPSVPLADL